MPELVLPFEPIEITETHEEMLAGGLFAMLSEELQEAAKKQSFLLEYLHMIPIEEIGVPRYFETLARSLSDEKNPNIIYPTQGGIFIHIYPMPHNDRHLYIPVEPNLTINMDAIIPRIEEALLDYTKEFDSLENEDALKQAFITVLDKICKVKKNGSGLKTQETLKAPGTNGSAAGKGGFAGKLTGLFSRTNGGGSKIELTADELNAVKYLIVREKVGVGLLDPLLGDIYVEDVSCSGVGQIFIEHKIFHSVITAVNIPTMEELDDFAKRMSERMKRPVTLNDPIQDATLPDGSRINIVFGEDVSRRGTSFTIRRAMGTPTSIMDIVGFGTMTYQMAAYMSLVMEEDMNVFVAGETASGKTTTINALTVFLSPTNKIVSIEDTPELVIPHTNWLREVSKESKDGKGAQVGMFDLLRAALRQRPNMIIGHGVMATFHAASVEKLIQRLTGDPINVPKNYIDCLNCILIQSAVKLPNGKLARRVISISEIIGYDSVSQSFSFIHSFMWNPAKDEFEFPGHMNSYLLEEKIAPKRGLPPEKKRNIYNELNRRARILERLHKEKGVSDFYELLNVLSAARKEGVF